MRNDIVDVAETDGIYGMDGASIPSMKFCGLSHLSDVEAMNEILPDYVGFVFWPKSRRLVDAGKAASLREALDPSIRTVGVFVDADADEIADLYDAGIISVAQLHGSEDAAYVDDLRQRTEHDGHAIEIWKAYEVKDADDIEKANSSTADLVLLDGGKGEGRTFPWHLLDGIGRPFALAGGLGPDNIEDALKRCTPKLIDVSSSIEAASEQSAKSEGSSTPHKDPELMKAVASKVRHRNQRI